MQGGVRILERQGLGTQWWANVFDETAPALAEHLRIRLEAALDEFESLYSRFRPTSLVGRLNHGEVLADFPAELFELLSWGEYLRELSRGYFTLGIGTALERLGYDSRYSFAADAPQALAAASPLGVLKPGRIQLAPGCRLDLGGIGKGWLIDKLADILAEEGVGFFCVNGGGDIFATSDNGRPLRFALESPFGEGMAIGSIAVAGQAIAASGGQKRRWKDALTGIERHHLVDPFSGESADRRAAVFTQAQTAVQADAASTVLYLVPDELVAPVADQLKVEYLLVAPDGTAVRSPGYSGELHA